MGSGGENVGADRVVSLLLVVEPDPELDPDVGERLARRLRAELDVESVDDNTIELERASAGLQQELVDGYVQRHTSGRAG